MGSIPRKEIEASLLSLRLQAAKVAGAIEILQNQLMALDAKQKKDK